MKTIVNTERRLLSIPELEMALARGRMQFADLVAGEDTSTHSGLIDLETYLAYEKPLRNLQIQESRLRRAP